MLLPGRVIKKDIFTIAPSLGTRENMSRLIGRRLLMNLFSLSALFSNQISRNRSGDQVRSSSFKVESGSKQKVVTSNNRNYSSGSNVLDIKRVMTTNASQRRRYLSYSLNFTTLVPVMLSRPRLNIERYCHRRVRTVQLKLTMRLIIASNKMVWISIFQINMNNSSLYRTAENGCKTMSIYSLSQFFVNQSSFL